MQTGEAQMADTSKRRYPQRKERDLTEREKKALRELIGRGEGDIYELAREFGCSPSQVAGLKAAMNK
jgi:hypothetical protein